MVTEDDDEGDQSLVAASCSPKNADDELAVGVAKLPSRGELEGVGSDAVRLRDRVNVARDDTERRALLVNEKRVKLWNRTATV